MHELRQKCSGAEEEWWQTWAGAEEYKKIACINCDKTIEAELQKQAKGLRKKCFCCVNRGNVVNVPVVLVFVSISLHHSKSFLCLCFCLWQIFVSWCTQMFEAWHSMCLCGFSYAAWTAQQVHVCDCHVCPLWCPTYKRRHSNFTKCCRNAWHHALLALQDKDRFIPRWLGAGGELCILQFLTTRVHKGVKGRKRGTAWHHALLALQDRDRFIPRWLRAGGELCVLQFFTIRVHKVVKGRKRGTPQRKADFSSSSCKLAFPLHLLVLEVCKGEGSVKENWRKRKTWLLFCFCMLDNVDS